MTATVAGIHIGIDIHTNRPAGNTVPDGSLYSCSTHSLVYKSNFAGNSWATWATLGGTSTTVATDAIWDAAGDLAVGTGADTAAKLTKGADGTVLRMAAGAVGWAEQAGRLLAVHAYAPASTATYTSTSTSLADVDATNMAITFIAPASGNIVVSLTAYTDVAVGDGFWGLRESTTNLAGSVGRVIRGPQGAAIITTYRFYLSGVSAGSHTYKWSFSVGTGATMRILIQDGSTTPAWSAGLMEVWSAP
jgi:hypothetical protein